jgi:hypothetical protein
MKFVFLQSLFRGACLQKVSKNLKIKWNQVMLPKSGLSIPCTHGPLGMKDTLFIATTSYNIREYDSDSKKGIYS